MISASEARKTTDVTSKQASDDARRQLERNIVAHKTAIENRIKKACENGKHSIEYSTWVPNPIIGWLESHGYALAWSIDENDHDMYHLTIMW